MMSPCPTPYFPLSCRQRRLIFDSNSLYVYETSGPTPAGCHVFPLLWTKCLHTMEPGEVVLRKKFGLPRHWEFSKSVLASSADIPNGDHLHAF